MSIKRILKLLIAFLTGQGVAIVNQLLVPPLFIHRYANGMATYGEWIALSAAVSYLSSLNTGIQSYANNQMTIHYNRGEVDDAKAVQASALVMSLTLIAIVAIAGSMVLFLPVGRWLNLHHTSSLAASETILLLTLSLIVSWLFAILANSFMAVGKLHRGANWMNAQRLVSTLLLSAFLWWRSSFPILALIQFSVMSLFTLLVAFDLRATAPFLLPSLRCASLKVIKSSLQPSGMFALGTMSAFLLWQAPVLLIQTILGAESLAIFSLTRAVFNMSRQLLVVVSLSIGQEITILTGSRDWNRLHRLYDLSERVVLFLTTTVSVGTLLLCPFLFVVWLHKQSVFQPTLCILMAIISAVMAIKEHKNQFQTSTNQHQVFAIGNIIAYGTMCGLSIWALPRYGVVSLMVLWLCTEISQVILLLFLNKQLFPPEMHISLAPVARSVVVLTVCFGLSIWPVYQSVHWPLYMSVVVSVLTTACLGVLSYYLFGLKELQGRFMARLQSRNA
jgi:O-antigen/teichoic acid export membrane protein